MAKKQLAIVAVFLLCFLAVSGIRISASNQNSGSENQLEAAEQLIERARNHAYNGEFEEADLLFDECIARDPQNAICHWRKAHNLFFWIKSRQGGKEDLRLPDEEYGRVTKVFDVAIEKVGEKILRDEDKDLNLFIQSELFGLRGALEKVNRGLWVAVSSWKRSDELARQSNYPSARSIRGYTIYRLSLENGFYRWLARRGGFSTEQREGIDLIFSATEGNKSEFVDDIWFMIFSLEHDPKNLEKRYTDEQRHTLFWSLFQKYPKNGMLKNYCRDNLAACRKACENGFVDCGLQPPATK